MPGVFVLEQNTGGADQREDQRDWRRSRRSRSRRRQEFLGGRQFRGADTLTVPTLGRRPLAPGSTRLGPATLQEKRGQVSDVGVNYYIGKIVPLSELMASGIPHRGITSRMKNVAADLASRWTHGPVSIHVEKGQTTAKRYL
ncbi:hypothetical protein NDU88_006428 [Pleurodeles waltl]|uniref:Uncharacterized protein n=1 Tax=Pleurodeles waltl TaxID=8319 RepID=A0AAV7NV32_PLEWA|nr:hypothetical protein NDU88_006428 [Pleurodeles waltl]